MNTPWEKFPRSLKDLGSVMRPSEGGKLFWANFAELGGIPYVIRPIRFGLPQKEMAASCKLKFCKLFSIFFQFLCQV